MYTTMHFEKKMAELIGLNGEGWYRFCPKDFEQVAPQISPVTGKEDKNFIFYDFGKRNTQKKSKK